MDPLRVAVLVLGGGGMLVAYGKVLSERFGSWKLHHDQRALRDVLSATGLFIAAVFAIPAMAFLLLGTTADTPFHFVVAVSLGAFFAAGVVMVDEDRGRKP